jgi:3-dehydroquinate dehydratase type I
MIRYCLPIRKDSKAKTTDAISAAKDLYSFYEVWLDYIEDLDLMFVKRLVLKYESSLILLFRRDNLGAIRLTREKRAEIMEVLSGKKVLLDLDILTQKEDIEYIAKKKLTIPLLLSYHHYQKTPEDPELTQIVEEMDKHSPAIYKFATRCNKELDALRLLKLGLRLRQRGNRFICLGMGDHGRISRVFGPLWGAEMSFAPQDPQEASAPGQFTLSQMKELYKILAP